MKYVIPVLAGRMVRALARLRGGGSAYPGRTVLALAPDFLTHVSSQFERGVVFVLGSNGKSTTTMMLTETLRAHGLSVFTNPTGANLPQGIASAFLREVTPMGDVRHDIGVIEVDEAFAVELTRSLKPSTVLMLNVQVDQLYRFFETERVGTMMTDTAALASTAVVTNRDDQHLGPYEAREGQSVTRFGAAADIVAASPNGLQNANDFTRRADGTLEAQTEVVAVNGDGASIRVGETTVDIRLPARGLHYAVDAAAAIETASVVLGGRIDPVAVARAFDGMKPAYGRGERMSLGADEAEFIMFKNAASLQMNLDALPQDVEQVMLAIDEGTPDISWIYDIDFSHLDHVDVLAGAKAWQLALRLEHDGIPVHVIEEDISKAIRLMRALPSPSDHTKHFVTNYEQMMLARRILGHPDLEKSA
ncbi:MurT ligase domain-containing protein [Frigoribacterium faeni]|uniref:Glutamate ligase n=1 Tax=Frigoribacterium faeni TaxID=145483 RepID=A0A7W3JH46_9MICO|nr:MurT ligase domain-containing protein [Frigoribacterium faeni]MBA8812781.1 UDP-N-acetylmuramoylalanine-D-glutamate ligase [Frigoribacterium faeni]BFF13904.1 Mur ligase family protein [Microbacterium flavescens]GEK82407.1 glutamate ligase [Frigoribacterium faeni]